MTMTMKLGLLLSILPSYYWSWFAVIHYCWIAVLTDTTRSCCSIVTVVDAFIIIQQRQQQQQSPKPLKLQQSFHSAFFTNTFHENNEEFFQDIQPKSESSPFMNSRWKINLNFGLEPGSYMPQVFPEWAKSGARLGIPVELVFTDIPLLTNQNTTQDQSNTQKYLNSDSYPMYRVKVPKNHSSTFVSMEGTQHVEFVGGGYTMERAQMNKNMLFEIITPLIRGQAHNNPKPRFLLRFYVDCTSGAQRQDVTIEPNTRILGTIPIWDDPNQIKLLQTELNNVKQQIQNNKKDIRTRNNNGDNRSKNQETKFTNSLLFGDMFSFGFGRNLDDNDVSDDTSLSAREEQLERLLPLKGSVISPENGVQAAPKGSLVMPSSKDDIDGSYYIIGNFAMKPLPADDPMDI